MNTPSKRQRDQSEEELAHLCNVRDQWTPERSKRAINGEKQVRSAKDGPLMGGDWILNDQGEGATLSFCFRNSEGTETYGLTVGHLANSVGKSVFRFTESDPIPVPDGEGEEYFMCDIGEVTSISKETDSLVFKIDDLEKDDCSPMQIALSSQSHLTLDDNLLSLTKTPPLGGTMVGFGAQRRGVHCHVVVPSLASSGTWSLSGDIGLESSSGSTDAATDGGDCGTIFFLLEGGAPVYFHHVLNCDPDGKKISFGVPLSKILSAHDETRHLIPSCEDRQRAPTAKKSKTFLDHQGNAHESSALRQFQTKIVDRRTGVGGLVTKNASTSKEVSLAPLQLNPHSVEDQTLPVFNVRKTKKF